MKEQMRQRHIKIKKTNNKTPPHWGGVRYSISTDSGDHTTSAPGLIARISCAEMLHLVGRRLLFPTKRTALAFCGNPKKPLRWTHGSSANYKYMSSITDIVGQGSRSVRTCLILLGFRRGDPAWSPVSKCEFHRAE